MAEFIQPVIQQEKARGMLVKPPGMLKKKRGIEKIELFHLPSYIVEVSVLIKNEIKTQPLCIDAVQGSFAFLQASSTSESPPEDLHTCPFFLIQQDIENKALDEYRRHLLRLGLLMRIKFEIKEIVAVRPIYYPFWIGYFYRKGKIDFEVIDAVGGEHQGVLMRSVFMKALLNEEH